MVTPVVYRRQLNSVAYILQVRLPTSLLVKPPASQHQKGACFPATTRGSAFPACRVRRRQVEPLMSDCAWMRSPPLTCHSPVTRWLRRLVFVVAITSARATMQGVGYKSGFEGCGSGAPRVGSAPPWHQAAQRRHEGGWGDHDARSGLHTRRFTSDDFPDCPAW